MVEDMWEAYKKGKLNWGEVWSIYSFARWFEAHHVSFNDLAIRQFLDVEFNRMPESGCGVLLDLGCGIRPYQTFYKSRFDHCVSSDYDIRTNQLDVRLSACALPFASSTFDVVLMSEVIEHVAELDKALFEVSRVLKPDGVLLITWPFNYMMHEIPYDYVRYTEFGMEKLLEQKGIRIEAIVRRGNASILFLVLGEFFVMGGLEILVRTPVVGGFFNLIKQFVNKFVFGLAYRTYLAFNRTKTYSQDKVTGVCLKGIRGQLSHWTLGYCVRARKRV